MAAFLSDEWFASVVESADLLSEIEDVSFGFELEISESASGKVRAHGRVERGRLMSLASGKFVSDPAGTKPEVMFAAKAKRALPIITGQVNPLVAYMLGELKIDGAYELVVDRFAGAVDRQALDRFRERVAAATD